MVPTLEETGYFVNYGVNTYLQLGIAMEQVHYERKRSHQAVSQHTARPN